jgi:hypothetical protein
MNNNIETIKEQIKEIGEDRFKCFRENNIKIIEADKELEDAISFYREKDLNIYSTIISIICGNLMDADLIKYIKNKPETFNYCINKSPEILKRELEKHSIPECCVLKDIGNKDCGALPYNYSTMPDNKK